MVVDAHNGLGLAIQRVGEYERVFGIRGVPLAISHMAKFKVLGGPARTTHIPGWGAIYLRPRTSDLAIFREIFVDGAYDPRRHCVADPIEERCSEVRARGGRPVIVDAGANVGLATVFLARSYPDADFVLIEPDRDNADVARKNTAHISSARVCVCALHNQSGRIVLNKASEHAANTTGGPLTEGSLVVEAVTMQDLLGERMQDLVLVKMDIEGAERAVFSKNADWLDAPSPVLLVEPHDGTINDRGSLGGLLARPHYREGKVLLNGSTLLLIPNKPSRLMKERS